MLSTKKLAYPDENIQNQRKTTIIKDHFHWHTHCFSYQQSLAIGFIHGHFEKARCEGESTPGFFCLWALVPDRGRPLVDA